MNLNYFLRCYAIFVSPDITCQRGASFLGHPVHNVYGRPANWCSFIPSLDGVIELGVFYRLYVTGPLWYLGVLRVLHQYVKITLIQTRFRLFSSEQTQGHTIPEENFEFIIGLEHV